MTQNWLSLAFVFSWQSTYCCFPGYCPFEILAIVATAIATSDLLRVLTATIPQGEGKEGKEEDPSKPAEKEEAEDKDSGDNHTAQDKESDGEGEDGDDGEDGEGGGPVNDDLEDNYEEKPLGVEVNHLFVNILADLPFAVCYD